MNKLIDSDNVLTHFIFSNYNLGTRPLQQNTSYNSQHPTTYPGINANPTTQYSRPVLSQGVQLNSMPNLPRASILQANANATYQRPALVIIKICSLHSSIPQFSFVYNKKIRYLWRYYKTKIIIKVS